MLLEGAEQCSGKRPHSSARSAAPVSPGVVAKGDAAHSHDVATAAATAAANAANAAAAAANALASAVLSTGGHQATTVATLAEQEGRASAELAGSRVLGPADTELQLTASAETPRPAPAAEPSIRTGAATAPRAAPAPGVAPAPSARYDPAALPASTTLRLAELAATRRAVAQLASALERCEARVLWQAGLAGDAVGPGKAAPAPARTAAASAEVVAMSRTELQATWVKARASYEVLNRAWPPPQ